MCLSVKENYPRPEEPAIRYKLVNVGYKGLFNSIWYMTTWSIGKTYKKKRQKDIQSSGFHVFVSKRAANTERLSPWKTVLKVECRDFRAGGYWEDSRTKTEIWGSVKVLEECSSKK